MKKIVLFLVFSFASSGVFAFELNGVRLADTVHLGNSNLVLNGAGVRSKFIFDLYVAALYLNAKKTSSAGVLADPGEKRIVLHLLDDISAPNMLHALKTAIEKNHTDDELRAMKLEMEEFENIGHKMGHLHKGDVIEIDYQIGTGTRISVNSAFRGAIKGWAFNIAFLKIWLGEHPAQEDLKLKLLGGK